MIIIIFIFIIIFFFLLFLFFYLFFFFLDVLTVQFGPSPTCSVSRDGKWGNLTGAWYKYVVAYSKICLGRNEKKAREIFDGLFSGRDSNRAFASLEGLSETMKQVKYIHQDSNWVPPEYNLTFVPLHWLARSLTVCYSIGTPIQRHQLIRCSKITP